MFTNPIVPHLYADPRIDGGGWLIIPGLGPAWVPPWRPHKAANESTPHMNLATAVAAALDALPSEAMLISQRLQDFVRDDPELKTAPGQLKLLQRALEDRDTQRAVERVRLYLARTPVSPFQKRDEYGRDGEGRESGGSSPAPVIGFIITALVILGLLAVIFG